MYYFQTAVWTRGAAEILLAESSKSQNGQAESKQSSVAWSHYHKRIQRTIQESNMSTCEHIQCDFLLALLSKDQENSQDDNAGQTWQDTRRAQVLSAYLSTTSYIQAVWKSAA